MWLIENLRLYVCVCVWRGAQLCLTLCEPMDCSLPGSSMEFSRQKYGSRLPFSTPGDLPDPRIEPASLASCFGRQVLCHCTTWKALKLHM